MAPPSPIDAAAAPPSQHRAAALLPTVASPLSLSQPPSVTSSFPNRASAIIKSGLLLPKSELGFGAPSLGNAELVSMWNLTKVEIQLCNMLSPEGPNVFLGSYNWGLVFIAVLVDNFLYPISAFRSHFSQSINWSGIRYYLRDGKISKIERENSSKYTDLGGKHLYGKRTYPPRTSLLGYLSRSLAQWHQPKKYDV